MFENVKNDTKTPQIKSELLHDVEQPQNTINTFNNVTSVPQVLERPVLPKRQFEDNDGVQQPMTGMLYDYQYLNSSLW